MINNLLDPAPWRAKLLRDGRVQVADYLQESAAERLHLCLSEQVEWTLALRDAEGPRTLAASDYAALSPPQRTALFAEIAASASGNQYRFAYDSYMMVRAYLEQRDDGLLLHKVLEFFNSPDYIAWMQALTGDTRIRRVNAQATRYRPGQFLRYHTDADSTEGRLYAYVINLGREWEADWGGLLQFIDESGAISETYLPRWNSLSLFRVPAGHAGSMVMPWAGADRLAITGWCLL